MNYHEDLAAMLPIAFNLNLHGQAVDRPEPEREGHCVGNRPSPSGARHGAASKGGEMKKNSRRLLCRTLAKELQPEDLGLSKGANFGLPYPPEISSMMATLPDFREDA